MADLSQLLLGEGDSDEEVLDQPQLVARYNVKTKCKAYACIRFAYALHFLIQRVTVKGEWSDWQVSEPPKGGAVSASLDDTPDDDFYRQLAAVNALPASRATPEPPANATQAAVAQQQPVSSPPASKGNNERHAWANAVCRIHLKTTR